LQHRSNREIHNSMVVSQIFVRSASGYHENPACSPGGGLVMANPLIE
jgi:hypothetical protein